MTMTEKTRYKVVPLELRDFFYLPTLLSRLRPHHLDFDMRTNKGRLEKKSNDHLPVNAIHGRFLFDRVVVK